MRSRGWASVDLVKTLAAKFTTDWRSTPADRRRAWTRGVVLACAAVAAALFLAIAFMKSALNGANQLDWEIRLLQALERGPFTFGNAIWFQTFGADSTLLFIVLFTAGIAIWHDRPLLALTIILTWVLMDATVRLGWLSFDRTRPTVIAEGVASPGFKSFPSGHTAKTLAVYGLLAAQWLRASRSVIERVLVLALTLGLVAAVPFGRLRTGVHWPTDVLGGYLVGGTWLVFALIALRHERR